MNVDPYKATTYACCAVFSLASWYALARLVVWAVR